MEIEGIRSLPSVSPAASHTYITTRSNLTLPSTNPSRATHSLHNAGRLWPLFPGKKIDALETKDGKQRREWETAGVSSFVIKLILSEHHHKPGTTLHFTSLQAKPSRETTVSSKKTNKKKKQPSDPAYVLQMSCCQTDVNAKYRRTHSVFIHSVRGGFFFSDSPTVFLTLESCKML